MKNPFESLLDEVAEKKVTDVPVAMVERSGRYSLGGPKRPDIQHDNGFLDCYKPESPTTADRLSLARWKAKLIGAEAICNNGVLVPPQWGCKGEDLTEATNAYRNFLYGNGKDQTINYDRYLSRDSSAVILKEKIIADFKNNCEAIGANRHEFSLTSEVYRIGIGQFGMYPATVNWQKAIGAHVVWVSATVNISIDKNEKISYAAVVTIHMEDRYNFNPGSADIETGTPDAENGRFEVTGLAHQYTNYGTSIFQLNWSAD